MATTTNDDDSYYTVATMLYTPVSDSNGVNASSTIRKNLDIMSEMVTQAAANGKAQIIVFPESTTGTLQWPNFSTEKVVEYAEVYARVGEAVCDDAAANSSPRDRNLVQQHTMACQAKNNSIYVVVNIPELMDCRIGGDGATRRRRRRLVVSSPAEVTCADLSEKRIYVFNSLAIYDPRGVMIAKYRKTNTFPLYFDTAFPGHDKEKVDLTTFTADFGVTFGVLICADITNPHIVPRYVEGGIQHLLVPLYDGGRPPVTSITALHAGHAYNYGVNLLASQSQTFSGVGLYQSNASLYWNINTDPFSGQPFYDLIVQNVSKTPEPPAPLGEPITSVAVDAAQQQQAVEECRWLGLEGTEVVAPCIRIDVPSSGESVAVQAQLKQWVGDVDDELVCNMTATLSVPSDVAQLQTYAMMVGVRPSEKVDYALFCELVVCNDFPDCSLGCPLCTSPYLGYATLNDFELEASVPAYFESGGRQMRFPILNGLAGQPQLGGGETLSWAFSNGRRYMKQSVGRPVSNLMAAGIFYIGFAPLSVDDDEVPPVDNDSQQPPTTSAAASNVDSLVLLLWTTTWMMFRGRI